MPDVTKRTRTREVTTTVEEDVVVLTLSIEEAAALLAVTGAVTGALREGSPRRGTDAIFSELSIILNVSEARRGMQVSGTVRLDPNPEFHF